MKTTNILIPTDFSLESLQAVPALIQQQPGQKFNITMVNFLGLSDSISDLLMLSRRSREYEYVTQEFLDELTRLSREYGEYIESLQTEFFYGNTVALFKNYLEARDINQIARLKQFSYIKLTPMSNEPDAFLDRAKCPIVDLIPYITVQPTKIKALHSTDQLELEQV
ncbi:hypothetical protein [Mucilaginibacter pedocola]|uniref:UspA domain-containing protein n=1 Tax=Mucilaginibacter pedocola TaxID=1792845 RepID=A0A1S9PMI9_9SPHI|nr:hypothetical protein [Mucilaginibacter pedocola]OOQ62147.1 hypothetical protein BC343_03600 [Mucilaginibacter pedocola]